MDHRIPKRMDNVIEKRLPDELVIVNTNTNELMVPSSGGEAIWKLIDGHRTIDEIIEQICSDYGIQANEPTEDEGIPDAIGEVISVKGETVSEQVRAFVDLLIEKGVVRLITPAD